MSTRIGKKTGPKPRFTTHDAVLAAFDLGIDRFTLGGVAKKLGVATSAVYRLFDGRDALTDACLAHAARDLAIDESGTWQHVLRSWVEQLWNLCEKYPGLDITVYQFPGAHRHIQPQLQQLTNILIGQGFSREKALFAIDFIGDTAISTHIGVASYRHLDPHSLSGRDISGDFFAPEETWTERGFLDQKIEFIIQGLDTER